MPPTERVKKSVRFEPEAIAILDTYAATHNCNLTDALNAIILASIHTHPKLPPIVATQDRQDKWQQAIEVRLTKLEAATQVPPIVATQDSPPKFEKGQVITGGSAKAHFQILGTAKVSQEIDGVTYHLSNDLGIIYTVYGKSASGRPKFKIFTTFPGDEVAINADGTFLMQKTPGQLEWFTKSELAALAEASTKDPTAAVETVNEEIAIEPTKEATSLINEPPTEAVAEAPPTEPMRLSTEELLEHFKPKLANLGMVNTIRTNLGQVGIKKLVNGWASQHDPEGKTWIPADETREYWVVGS